MHIKYDKQSNRNRLFALGFYVDSNAVLYMFKTAILLGNSYDVETYVRYALCAGF